MFKLTDGSGRKFIVDGIWWLGQEQIELEIKEVLYDAGVLCIKNTTPQELNKALDNQKIERA